MANVMRSVALLAVVVITGGCEDSGVGRLCDIGVDAGMNSGQSIINGAALECPSRTCLAAVPNAPNVMNTRYQMELPQCTASCESDDDCSDGLTNKSDMRLCGSSFKCAVATTVGPFSCKKLCICGDFIKPPVQTPSACQH